MANESKNDGAGAAGDPVKPDETAKPPAAAPPAEQPKSAKNGRGKTVEIIPTASIDVGREASGRGGKGRGKILSLPIGKRVRVDAKDAERYLTLQVAKLPDEDEEE